MLMEKKEKVVIFIGFLVCGDGLEHFQIIFFISHLHYRVRERILGPIHRTGSEVLPSVGKNFY